MPQTRCRSRYSPLALRLARELLFNRSSALYTIAAIKQTESMKRDATFSDDRKRRFVLIRDWHDESPLTPIRTVNFIMLNPSVAGEVNDDLTITKCVGFSRKWGFTRLVVTNLIPLVSTDPKKLPRWTGTDSKNEVLLRKWMNGADMIVAAWGSQPRSHGEAIGLGQHVDRVLSLAPSPIHCIGITKHGAPLHPSRAGYTDRPQRWH